jgi:hypothetical protein
LDVKDYFNATTKIVKKNPLHFNFIAIVTDKSDWQLKIVKKESFNVKKNQDSSTIK